MPLCFQDWICMIQMKIDVECFGPTSSFWMREGLIVGIVSILNLYCTPHTQIYAIMYLNAYSSLTTLFASATYEMNYFLYPITHIGATIDVAAL